ncbi:MAG: hypothetical protein ACPGVU_13795 [Limisphaerales bacterium]
MAFSRRHGVLEKPHRIPGTRSQAVLAYLEEWTLPTVAVLTRSREHLKRASEDEAFVSAAAALQESPAHWLHSLLGAQLSATWFVIAPTEKRAFEVVMHGIVSNFDLHALLAAALVPLGIAGKVNPPDVIDYLRGKGDEPSSDVVVGSWNLYQHTALSYDLSDPNDVPQDAWAWGEGVPNDIAKLGDKRVLVIGPTGYERSWGAGRMFDALPASIEVVRELSADEMNQLMAEAT